MNVLRAQHPSKLSAAAPPVTNLQRCTALQIGMLEWGEMYTYPGSCAPGMVIFGGELPCTSCSGSGQKAAAILP